MPAAFIQIQENRDKDPGETGMSRERKTESKHWQ